MDIQNLLNYKTIENRFTPTGFENKYCEAKYENVSFL
jgi:hypothetical protein